MSEKNNEATTARAKLDRERAALSKAQAALAHAERKLDARAIANEKSLIAAHVYVIGKLEGEAAREVEEESKAKAKPMAKAMRRQLSSVAAQITSLQDERSLLVRQINQGIEQETKLRESIQATVLGLELVSARFPDLDIKEVGDVTPPFVDSGGPIVRAEDKLMQLRRRVVYFDPTRRACDTEEQKRWEDLAELRKLVQNYRDYIPQQVLSVIEPLPAWGSRPKDAPRPGFVTQTKDALSRMEIAVDALG